MSRKALTLTVTVPVPDAAGIAARLQAWPARVGRTVLLWQARASERAQLRGLDERMRRDMGLSYESCRREADKPFWQP